MLGRNGRKGHLRIHRLRAQHRTCLRLSSADRTDSRHLGGTRLPEVLGLALLKVAQAQTLVAMKKYLQRHLLSADDRLWSLNHRRYHSAVLPVLTTRQPQAQHFTHHQGHRRHHWKSHHEEDRRKFRRDSSLRLKMDLSLHQTPYHHHNPHHLLHRHYPLLLLLQSRLRHQRQCRSL
jgi:hypothetical protein